MSKIFRRRAVRLMLAVAACLLPKAAVSHAAVTIAKEPTPLVVSTDAYTARVEGDGCLTSLRIAGRELLAPGVGVSRGGYFYRNGTLALRDISQPDEKTIVAQGSEARAEYRFDDSGVTVTVSNQSQQDTLFFLVLAGDLEAVLEEGKAVAPAVTKPTKSATFALGDAKLEASGLDRLWGPWSGPHQVCEVLLKPGDARELKLTAAKVSAEEHASVVALVKLAAELPITLFAPLDYQVVQRSTRTAGECSVRGRTAEEVDAVEFRVAGKSDFGPIPGDWQAATYNKSTRGFAAHASLPAGGWYSLEVRAVRGDQPAATTKVDHFGIGEVFVGAGQSNSTNCGETPTKQTTGMVASFGGDQWKLADDPQLGVADRSTGGSFWPAFGDAMYERYKVPIGVAATGFGGTSVSQWQPEGDLFKWMTTRVRQLGPRGFRALLWHQGESDVDMPPAEYQLKLSRLIQTSRDEADWQIPWFVAQATYHNMQRPKTDSIRDVQAALATSGVALPGPDTDLLQEEYRDWGGKGIHFSPKGLKKHGDMWFEKVAPFVDAELDATPGP